MISANMVRMLGFAPGAAVATAACGGGAPGCKEAGAPGLCHCGRAHLQQSFDRFREPLEMRFERRRERVEPVHRAHEIGERLGRRDVLDPHRHDRNAHVDGALDLAADLARAVGARREDQNNHAAIVDGLDDGGAPFGAGRDVARRDPATDAGFLKRGAGSVGRRLVGMRVADECVVCHAGATSYQILSPQGN